MYFPNNLIIVRKIKQFSRENEVVILKFLKYIPERFFKT